MTVEKIQTTKELEDSLIRELANKVLRAYAQLRDSGVMPIDFKRLLREKIAPEVPADEFLFYYSKVIGEIHRRRRARKQAKEILPARRNQYFAGLPNGDRD